MQERTSGWVGFAWMLFLVIGIWNVIEGILGLARSSFWTDTGSHYVFSDLRTWAWIVMIWGFVEILAALSIAAGGGFGRWFGIIVAGIAIIIQLMFVPAAPFWALLAIFFYIMVMYGLIAQYPRSET
jgi:hypothetical protein